MQRPASFQTTLCGTAGRLLKPDRPAAAQGSGFHSALLPEPTDQVHEGTQTNITSKDCNCLIL